MHKRSDFAVGYGSAGGETLQFSLDEGVDSDIGFLKLFVSTKYVDMSILKQSFLFEKGRKVKIIKPPAVELRDTFAIKTQKKEYSYFRLSMEFAVFII